MTRSYRDSDIYHRYLQSYDIRAAEGQRIEDLLQNGDANGIYKQLQVLILFHRCYIRYYGQKIIDSADDMDVITDMLNGEDMGNLYNALRDVIQVDWQFRIENATECED